MVFIVCVATTTSTDHEKVATTHINMLFVAERSTAAAATTADTSSTTNADVFVPSVRLVRIVGQVERARQVNQNAGGRVSTGGIIFSVPSTRCSG